jgi:hypothetical protein
MASNPVEAGRKGGQSRSEAKLAACRRNGFQKQIVKPADENIAEQITTEATSGQTSEKS